MICKTINYTDDGRVSLKTYIPDVWDKEYAPLRPAMIACPSGAWVFLSPNEGEPVALTFVKEGYATFVLNYSIGDYSEFPNPLISETLHAPSEMFKPNAAVFAYGCNDLGTIFDSDDPDLVIPSPGKITADRTPQIDVVNCVTKDTAPIFFYHCRNDVLVPVKNTWLLAEKLDEFKLPFEMHIFGTGGHGMSVHNRLTTEKAQLDPSVSQWVSLCIAWLDGLFGR